MLQANNEIKEEKSSSSISTILSETEKIINKIRKEKENEAKSLLKQLNDTNRELQEKITKINEMFAIGTTTTILSQASNINTDDLSGLAQGTLSMTNVNANYAPSVATGITGFTGTCIMCYFCFCIIHVWF